MNLFFSKSQRLLKEVEIYKKILEDHIIVNKGNPNIYYSGKFGLHNVLIMDLLVPNLKELFIECKNKFSLKTQKQVSALRHQAQ